MHFLPLLFQLEGVLRVSVPSLGMVCMTPLSRHSPAPLRHGLGFPSGVSRRNVCWNPRPCVCVGTLG